MDSFKSQNATPSSQGPAFLMLTLPEVEPYQGSMFGAYEYSRGEGEEGICDPVVLAIIKGDVILLPRSEAGNEALSACRSFHRQI